MKFVRLQPCCVYSFRCLDRTFPVYDIPVQEYSFDTGRDTRHAHATASSAHTFHNTQQQSQSYRISTRTTRTTAIPQGIAVAVVQTDWGHSTCAWFARVLFYCFRLYLFVAIYVYTGADNVTMQCDTAAICDYAHHDFRGARRLEGLKIGSVISYRSVSNMQHDTYKAHAWR